MAQINSLPFHFLVPEDSVAYSTRIRQTYYVPNRIIESIQIDYMENTQYDFQNLLANYGQPDEVWIQTNRSAYGFPSNVFRFVLYYSEKGILTLAAVDGEVVGDVVRACPHQAIGGPLNLFRPGLGLPFEEAQNRSGIFGGSNEGYLPLQDVTDLSMEEFYLRYREEGPQECLETPKFLWP